MSEQGIKTKLENITSYTFRCDQKDVSTIQLRLHYTFISNNLQEFLTTTEILAPFHFPVRLSLSQEKGSITGKGFWKFNISKNDQKQNLKNS